MPRSSAPGFAIGHHLVPLGHSTRANGLRRLNPENLENRENPENPENPDYSVAVPLRSGSHGKDFAPASVQTA